MDGESEARLLANARLSPPAYNYGVPSVSDADRDKDESLPTSWWR